MRKCSIQGCTNTPHSRGWCGKHYTRWRKWGDPEYLPPPGRRRRTPEESAEVFWAKVDKAGDCWLWQGFVDADGYGRAYNPETMKSMTAHRVAYMLDGNELTPGMHVDHTCRNTLCMRPSHLEEVTPAENLRRQIEAGTNILKK